MSGSLEQLELELVRKLGRGPVGASYAVRWGGDVVVAKVLTTRLDAVPVVREQILDDLRAWADFSHSGAGCPLRVGKFRQRHTVLFAPLSGATLAERMRADGPYQERRALEVVRDVAEVLSAAAGRGGVGDLRPTKIFDDGRRVRLADLGLARASCLANGFGVLGLAFGHPAYLAPEVLQERCQRPTPASDLYALGVTLYELICGAPPFDAADPRAALRQHLSAPLPQPTRGCSVALAGLILRLTAKTPERRPSARSLLHTVQRLLETYEPAVGEPALGARERSPDAQPEAALGATSGAKSSQRAFLEAALADVKRPAESDASPPLGGGQPPGGLAISAPRTEPSQRSTLEVEEFDPTATTSTVSPLQWSRDSKSAAKHTRSWSPENIAALTGGVPSLSVLMEECLTSSDLNMSPRLALAGGGRSVAIRSSTAALVTLSSALGLLLLGCWFVVARDSREAEGNLTPPSAPSVPDPKPTGSVGDAPPLTPDELDALSAEAISALETRRYRDALDLLAPLRHAAARDQQAAVRLAELERRVHEVAAARLEGERTKILAQLSRREVALATRTIDEAAVWALAPQKIALLRRRAEAVDEASTRALRAFEDDPTLNVEETRAKLSRTLAGWSEDSALFAGGGVAVRYRFDSRPLLSDLVWLRGPPGHIEACPGAPAEKGIRLRAGAKPRVIALRLPLRRLLEARVEFVLAAEPGADSDVVLAAGLRPGKQGGGCGVSWGTTLVEIRPRGLVPLFSAPLPARAPSRLLGIDLAFQEGKRGRSAVRGFLRLGARRQPSVIAMVDGQAQCGLVGLYLRNVDLWWTGLEVRGRIAAAKLK